MARVRVLGRGYGGGLYGSVGLSGAGLYLDAALVAGRAAYSKPLTRCINTIAKEFKLLSLVARLQPEGETFFLHPFTPYLSPHHLESNFSSDKMPSSKRAAIVSHHFDHVKRCERSETLDPAMSETPLLDQ